ncbi:hypothetical protein DFH09DRAFT_1134870 [Mycena vulgaris]|nr:hypothetical protein DFH09DRAFT_1134870 [Mycena vulgaris]
MSSSQLPSTRSRLHEHMLSLQSQYLTPTKQFMEDSFQEYPLATSVFAIFAATSFTPVVMAIALAVFTVCLAGSICLLTLIGLALCLSVVLSTTLVSSAVTAALGAGLLRIRSLGLWISDHRSATRTAEGQLQGAAPGPHVQPVASKAIFTTKQAVRAIFPRLKGAGWKARILAVTLFCELISRIHLPRVVRHNPIYRTIFGAALFGPRRSHIFQRALSRPFAILRAGSWVGPTLGFKLVRLPFRLFGWKAPLIAYMLLLILSPRLRGAARRALARVSVRLFDTAAAGAIVILDSAPVAAALDLPWKEYTTTAFACGKDIMHTALAALLGFLRAQLEQMEERAPQPAPAPQSPSEDSTYEMVPAVAPRSPAASASGMTAGGTSTGKNLRARNISGLASEDA